MCPAGIAASCRGALQQVELKSHCSEAALALELLDTCKILQRSVMTCRRVMLAACPGNTIEEAAQEGICAT